MAKRDKMSRGYLSEAQSAWLLLTPFLAVYALFLVYPFFRGFWISLHDWNLLAVAFNPDAKEFVGFRNYERVMWGRNIEWGALASPVLQTLGVLGIGAATLLRRLNRVSKTTALTLGGASVLLFVLPGFHPGEGGRWFDRRFWPTVANTRSKQPAGRASLARSPFPTARSCPRVPRSSPSRPSPPATAS